MVFFSWLGNSGMIWIILTIILLIIPKTRKRGIVMMLALLLDLLLCDGILKHLVSRTRPCDINTAIELLIARPTDYSFPSGHTAAAFASVTALKLSGEKVLWKVSLVLAAIIAFSRLYLYVHFPTDVLGGLVVGLICGCLAYVISKKFVFRKIKICK